MEQDKTALKTMQSVFGNRLSACIDESGIKQAKFATAIHVSESNVSRWVHGTSFPKTIEDIYYIAEYFHVSIDYLLGRTDIKSADMEIRAISEYTGIPEETVLTLADYKTSLGKDFIPIAFSNDFFSLSLVFNIIKENVEMLTECLNTYPLTDEFFSKYSDVIKKQDSLEEYAAADYSIPKDEISENIKSEYYAWQYVEALSDIRDSLRNDKYELLEKVIEYFESVCHISQAMNRADKVLDEKNALLYKLRSCNRETM